jgi:ATP-dependent helicase HrpA
MCSPSILPHRAACAEERWTARAIADNPSAVSKPAPVPLRPAQVAAVPPIKYPEALPVSARRDEIARAILDHQVIIVCGETGSGKTTQLPKIVLDIGRGWV